MPKQRHPNKRLLRIRHVPPYEHGFVFVNRGIADPKHHAPLLRLHTASASLFITVICSSRDLRFKVILNLDGLLNLIGLTSVARSSFNLLTPQNLLVAMKLPKILVNIQNTHETKCTVMFYITNESGAVTVDWVVLTAGLVGLGLASMTFVSSGVQNTSGDISTQLNEDHIIRSSFKFAPTIQSQGYSYRQFMEGECTFLVYPEVGGAVSLCEPDVEFDYTNYTMTNGEEWLHVTADNEETGISTYWLNPEGDRVEIADGPEITS